MGTDEALPTPEAKPAKELASSEQDWHTVAEKLDELTAQVSRFHERSERHEEIIRAMNERITELQGDQILALLRPTIQRLAGLHAQASDARAAAAELGEKSANDFAFFARAIEEALGLIDLDSVGAEPDGPFDATAHHVTATVPTDDPTLDRRIKRVIRQGFAFSGARRVSVPAQVVLYSYAAPPSPTVEPPSPGENSEDIPHVTDHEQKESES